ncbi:MAG: single-stranded-DNA-specific exonuclease RecJ, partial [Pontibacterium sp.]
MSISIETRSLPDRQAPIFQQVPDVLARVYAARGVIDLNDLGRGLKELLPVTQMAGIPAAVERIALAMENQERILILGDFDCDGATSTAVAISALTSMGASDVDYLVPNRFEFGYGLSPEIVEVAAEKSAQLIITVDNGISSVEGVERANALGIDVIVTDHHLAGSELPSAVAIVNPNQPSCIFPAKSTCGVGVIFYVMIALRRYLDEQGWFLTKQIPAPNLGELLDLVALGTVADVVALEKNNRVLVHQGLQRIRAGHLRPGLRALLAVADRDTRSITAADLGFAIAPRLNAAGRLDDMSLGIECLLARTDEDANIFAQQLNQLNLDRRGIESDMQQQAQVLLDDLNIKQEGLPFGICLFNQDWHQGVIGILASRVKEKYHRPVVAFAPAENGELKGSARSIAGFHIRDGLDAIAAKHPALLR